MSFECNIAEQQMKCGQKEPDQWWLPESAYVGGTGLGGESELAALWPLYHIQ